MTAPNPARTAPARPTLPKGVKWSNVWKVDGAFHEAPAGVEMPVNDRWEIVGRLWVCPVDGCDLERWTFDDTTAEDAPCCSKHPTRMANSPLDGSDPDPAQAARNRASAYFTGLYQRRRDAVVDAASVRASAARKAVEEATRRTAADMRGHAPSIAASGLILAAGVPLIVTDPILAAVTGVAAGPAALAAYIATMIVRWLRKTAQRDEKQARRSRRMARHVASGVLATGIWLVASAVSALLPTFLHLSFTLLFGLLLTFAVNNAHWQDLWATRHRLKEMARRKAEAERRRLEEEARRLAEQAAKAPAPAEAVVDESDPLVVGERMAAEWRRLAATQTVGGGFPQMPRTWIAPAETRELTAPDGDGNVVRIGWEYSGHAQPGALVARPGMPSPVVAAREWLAATLFDGRFDVSKLSIVDRPGGQANRFVVMVTERLRLGDAVPYKGRAGIRRGSDGALYGHAGQTLLGDDAERILWVPGQAGGGGRYGVTGSGKALALDTPIPTPTGWTTMGELRPGDEVFDENGVPCRVTFATPVMYDHDCFEVVLSDGATIVADAEHQWVTSTRLGRIQAARRARAVRKAALEQLIRHAETVLAGTDYPVTVGAAVDAVGPEYRHAARKAAQTLTPMGTSYGRNYGRAATYSAHNLHRKWVELAAANRNQSRAVKHDVDPVTTEQIAATLTTESGHLNHAIALAGALHYPAKNQPLPAYMLGAWLGDGTSRGNQLTTADQEILDELAAEGVVARPLAQRYQYGLRLATDVGRRGSVTGLLREVGVLGNKHIPDGYLRGSIEQRLALMQGLLDTDGYCTANGTAEFTNTSRRLVLDVLELALGLGFKATLRAKACAGRNPTSSTAYTVAFTTDVPVFRLPRKLHRQQAFKRRSTNWRYVTDVRPVATVPVRCIQVDSPSHMYLAGRECIPTHNTVVTQIALLNDLYAGIFPLLWDGKNFMDFAEFIGVIPMGCTIEHRDVMLVSVTAEMERRQQMLTLLEAKDRHGRPAPVEALWTPERDGPPQRWTIEEFHLHAGDDDFITKLTSLLRLQRSSATMLEVATQGGGLADTGNSVLRDNLNQIAMQVMRMGDGQARLTGYKGDYMPSELPRLPGMMLMVEADSPAVPVRGAYVHRRDEDGNIYDHLFDRDNNPILTAPALPAETVEVYEREGLMDLWRAGQGPGGKRRLLSYLPDVPSGVAVESLGPFAGQAMQAEDVVLAIAYHQPGLGPTAISRHPIWLKPIAGGKAPALSTITKPAARFEDVEGLLTREGGYRITEKGRARAAALAKTLFGGAADDEQAAEKESEKAE